MKRNQIGFICISIALISTGLSQEHDPFCELYRENGEKLSYVEWYLGVSLTIQDTAKPGTKIVNYKPENISAIHSVWNLDETNNEWGSVYYPPHTMGYLEIDYVDDSFYIELNEYFADFEEYETRTIRRILVKFHCNSYTTIRDIMFILSINDTNNHPPKFMGAPYKFNLPMPILKGYDITESFGKIVARDIDLTNENVTFTFNATDENSKGFLIACNGQGNKNYTAKFTTSETLDLKNDVTFVVYATDSGEPPLTSNTTVTIAVDKENSAPRFSNTLYTADLSNITYRDEVKELTVNFSHGILTLERGYKGIQAFEISEVSEENKKHLKLKHSSISQRNNVEVTLTLVDLSMEFLSQKVLSFIVKAVKDKVVAETALHILLPVAKAKYEENAAVTENNSTTGYLVAVSIMSLTIAGLLGYTIYYYKRSKLSQRESSNL